MGTAGYEPDRRRWRQHNRPPTWYLLTLDQNGEIAPSLYANEAKAAGLSIITWTFERSDVRNGALGQWYYDGEPGHNASSAIGTAITKPGDTYKALDVLAKDVGILGIFSDWPGSVTYYANCMDR